MKTKDYKLENISLDQAAEHIKKQRVKILNDFAVAYLAEKDGQIQPSELELVSYQNSQDGKIETIYYFRKREASE